MSRITDEYEIRRLNERITERRRLRNWWILGIGSTLIILGSIVFLAVCARAGDAHENGYSVGTLINVRDEGVLWERPAATLLHTGEMKGDEFALDDGLFALARNVSDRSARVRVEYVHRYVCWAWNYANCNIITRIDEDPIGSKP